MLDHRSLPLTAAVARARATVQPPPNPRFRLRDGARAAAVLMLFGPADGTHDDNDDPATAGPDDLPPERLDIVLEVRADTLRSHPGEVAFPGGGSDPEDVSPAATALREAAEEIGLDPADATVLGELVEFGTVSGYRVTPVVAWRTRAIDFAPIDQAETAAVLRTPVATLLDPAHRFTSVYRHATGDYRGPAFDLDGLIIWGITAFVLDAFFDAAGWTLAWDRTRERDI